MPTITLPTFHTGQLAAYRVKDPRTNKRPRFFALRCGRRFGKTQFLEILGADPAIKGQPVGYFAPDYKILSETYIELRDLLEPLVSHASRVDGVIRLKTGGRIDFWTLENERAGRSRKYKRVLIDEAAFAKPSLMQVWRTAIRPTLVDLRGDCVVASNTNGSSADNFLWRICNEPEHGFIEFHARTHDNPYLPADELERLQAENHPLVFQQEYCAEFVDWSGIAFFEKDKLLVNGEPVEPPTSCDQVFAVIDSAVKTGSENDGTGVSYWAYTERHPIPLICLDWDIVQIEGASLEVWIPSVFDRLEGYARQCRARAGSQGAWIEDAASGSILLQQCVNKGLPVQALPATMTAAGKDVRAINASGPVYRGLVKFARLAWEKVTAFKGVTRNHMASQVFGFRVGDKDAARRSDDLLDTFTYAVSICFGDSAGVN